MLVQALAEYADTYLKLDLDDNAFEEKLVQYALEIDEKGSFLGIFERIEQVNLGKKVVFKTKTMLGPKSPVSRTAGIYPLLGCDAIHYVIGSDPAWTSNRDFEKHHRHHQGFVALLMTVAKATGDEAVNACVKFYTTPESVAEARSSFSKKRPYVGTNVALFIRPANRERNDPGDALITRPAVRRYWDNHYEAQFVEHNAEAGEAMCLVSGLVGPIALTHDKIKGVGDLGGNSAGVALMSFDKEAYRSYGWYKNLNSPVSPERATAYIRALNDLLRHGEHRAGRSYNKVLRTRTDYGGVGFLYWTREPDDSDPIDQIENGTNNLVARLLSTPLSGKVEFADAVSENAFYLLAVSGNGGRLVVREWFAESLAAVQANVRHWFEDIRIADVFHGGASKPPRMRDLLRAMSQLRVERDDSVNADRELQMIRRALYGNPLGYSLLAAGLRRIRVVHGAQRFDTALVGLIRICINDLTAKTGGNAMSESLNENENNAAYICGRLLAVYGELQYAAQGNVNLTVVDRYYGSASSYPQLAFPRLEALSHSHLKILRRDNPGASVNIERKIQELFETLNAQSGKFPTQLNLEDQGRFAIGFHHQMAVTQENKRKAMKAKVILGSSESGE